MQLHSLPAGHHGSTADQSIEPDGISSSLVPESDEIFEAITSQLERDRSRLLERERLLAKLLEKRTTELLEKLDNGTVEFFKSKTADRIALLEKDCIPRLGGGSFGSKAKNKRSVSSAKPKSRKASRPTTNGSARRGTIRREMSDISALQALREL